MRTEKNNLLDENYRRSLKSTLMVVEKLLIEVMNNDEDPRIQQQALKALGFSDSGEISSHIEKAYQSNDVKWVSSSVVAMGRSADERWEPYVIKLLNNKQPTIRREAARAAGELEIRKAVPRLFELIEDVDEGTRLASIWSLSQIGGEGVRETLESLLTESEFDFEEDFLESALDNLAFTEDGALFPLFDFPDDQQLNSENNEGNFENLYPEDF
jgi:HEAT repeat protein